MRTNWRNERCMTENRFKIVACEGENTAMWCGMRRKTWVGDFYFIFLRYEIVLRMTRMCKQGGPRCIKVEYRKQRECYMKGKGPEKGKAEVRKCRQEKTRSCNPCGGLSRLAHGWHLRMWISGDFPPFSVLIRGAPCAWILCANIHVLCWTSACLLESGISVCGRQRVPA